MDNDSETVEYYFYDQKTKSIFTTKLPLSDSEKMKTDQNYRKFMHEQAMKIKSGQYVQKLDVNQTGVIEDNLEDLVDTNCEMQSEGDTQYEDVDDQQGNCDSSQIPTANISAVNHPKSKKKGKAPLSHDKDDSKASTSSDGLRGKYFWQYNDTTLLISSYREHREELNHHLRRKNFWDNICNDMVSHKYNVTKEMCLKKWQNLITTYRTCKDKTGRESIKFAFFDQIDEIVGDKPSNSSGHTKSSMKRTSTVVKEKENDKNIDNIENSAIDNQCDKMTESDRAGNSKKGKKLTKRQITQEKMETEKKRVELMSKMFEFEQRKSVTDDRRCGLLEKYFKNMSKD